MSSSDKKVKIYSHYAKKEIAPHQYLAEKMCERRAASFNQELPDKFWNVEGWKEYYFYQLKLASSLLKKYEVSVILKALKSDKCQILTSLRSAILNKECDKVILDQANNPINTDLSTERRYNEQGQFERKKNILDEL
jgi:hypothetical protein